MVTEPRLIPLLWVTVFGALGIGYLIAAAWLLDVIGRHGWL